MGLSIATATSTASGSTRLISQSAVSRSCIAVAATFVGPYTLDSNGGSLRITGVGVHGITAAVAVGKMIKVTGTNLSDPTGLGLYTITALDADTTGTKITVNETYSASQTVSAVTLANNEIVLYSANLAGGSIGATGQLSVTAIFETPNNANNKILRAKLGSSNVFTQTVTTSTGFRAYAQIFNRGAENSQISSTFMGIGSNSSWTGAGSSFSVDTSVDQVVSIAAYAASANDYVTVHAYSILAVK